MRPPDFGLSFEGGEAPPSALALAGAAQAGGAGHLWIACHLFRRDPITQAAMVLAARPGLRVTLMAMSPYSVHPVFAVMAAATLDEWFPGRVGLCFGVGSPRDLETAGIAAPHPLSTLREALEVARALLAGEVFNHQGQRFRIAERCLEFGPHPMSLSVAASGPGMLELAGRHADAVLISAATSVEFVHWCLEHVARGEAAAGRRVRRAGLVYVACAPDAAVAHARLRRTLAFILRGKHHARNLDLAGSRLDQEALAQAYAADDWRRVEALLTDEIVARHAASGTGADVRSRVGAYCDVGLDELVLAGQGDAAALPEILAQVRLTA